MHRLPIALVALAACNPSLDLQPGWNCPQLPVVGFDDPSPFGPSVAELVGPPPEVLTYSPGDVIEDWIPKSQEWLDEPPVVTFTPQWDSFTAVRSMYSSNSCDIGSVSSDGVGTFSIARFGTIVESQEITLRISSPNSSIPSGLSGDVPVPSETVIDAMLAEGRDPPLEGWIYSVHASPEIVAVRNFPAPGNDEAGNAIVKRAALVDPPLFAGGRLRSDGTLLPED